MLSTDHSASSFVVDGARLVVAAVIVDDRAPQPSRHRSGRQRLVLKSGSSDSSAQVRPLPLRLPVVRLPDLTYILGDIWCLFVSVLHIYQRGERVIHAIAGRGSRCTHKGVHVPDLTSTLTM